MAKDDYYVIVYKIMKYLYDCLKTGKNVDSSLFTPEALQIPESYCNYIFENLFHQQYVSGVVITPTLYGTLINTKQIQITPLGISYLFDNNLFSKAKKALKEVKETVPGL